MYFYNYCKAKNNILLENETTNTNFYPFIYLLGAYIFVYPQEIVFEPKSVTFLVNTISIKLSKSKRK